MTRYLAVILPLVAVASLAAADRDLRLLDAVRRGDQAVVRQLVQAKVDVNATDADGSDGAALGGPARRSGGRRRCCSTAGANVKAANRYGVTPLLVAVTNGNAAIVGGCSRPGADANAALPEGETALMTAARTGSVEAVKLLLAAGADVNAKESWRGQTALMWAAAENNAEVIRVLVEAGADTKLRSSGGFTPSCLRSAAGARRRSARCSSSASTSTRRFRRRRRRWPAGARRGGGAPAAAARLAQAQGGGGGQLTLAQVFNTGLRGRGTGTRRHERAAGRDHQRAFRARRRSCSTAAPTRTPSAIGWTPLHQLAWTRRPPIQHGLPPAVQTGELDSLDLARKLLAKGANPNARMTREPSDGARNVLNRIGSTPFLQAAKLGDIPYMRLLLEHGADAVDQDRRRRHAADGRRRRRHLAGRRERRQQRGRVRGGEDLLRGRATTSTPWTPTATRPSTAPPIAAPTTSSGSWWRRAPSWTRSNKLGWTPWIIADGVFYPNTYNRRLETAGCCRTRRRPEGRQAAARRPAAVGRIGARIAAVKEPSSSPFSVLSSRFVFRFGSGFIDANSEREPNSER